MEDTEFKPELACMGSLVLTHCSGLPPYCSLHSRWADFVATPLSAPACPTPKSGSTRKAAYPSNAEWLGWSQNAWV